MLISERLMLPSVPDPTPGKYGGRLSLGLANVAVWTRVSGDDLLDQPERFVAWLGHANAATPDEVAALTTRCREHPGQTAAELERLRDLAGALAAVFEAGLARQTPPEDDLRTIASHLEEAMHGARLRPDGGSFALEFPSPGSSLDAMRLAAARSAAAVLASRGDLAHLKRCPRDDCQFLFVDDSRNQTRRWCDTRLCGNRARVARHYARTREARGTSSRAEPTTLE
jgi:predicted RNA-binding Zn ribbon-like protein